LPAYVAGVEISPEYAASARERLDEVTTADLELFLSSPHDATFDCVVAADVLEHLVDPWEASSTARICAGSPTRTRST
jgi:predicted TPR repeat methyltransferase